jgi:hypothetical protein
MGTGSSIKSYSLFPYRSEGSFMGGINILHDPIARPRPRAYAVTLKMARQERDRIAGLIALGIAPNDERKYRVSQEKQAPPRAWGRLVVRGHDLGMVPPYPSPFHAKASAPLPLPR